MCLLIHYPAGIKPDVDALWLGALNNPDGHGFAMVTPHGLHVTRGMDAQYVIDRFLEMRSKFPNGDALFHSRIATAGNVTVWNCHPFRVGGSHKTGDARTVIAHNGILPRKAQPGKGDHRSDTRKFAEDHLPIGRFGSIRTHGGRRHIERWLGIGSKLVILTVDPRYKRNTYILNERLGHWHGGAWYSNYSYEPGGVGTYYGRDFGLVCKPGDECGRDDCTWCFGWSPETDRRALTAGKAWDEIATGLVLHTDGQAKLWIKGDTCALPECRTCGGPTGKGIRMTRHGQAATVSNEPWDCGECGAYCSVSPVSGFCGVCGGCYDCGQTRDECDCYVPSASRRLPAQSNQATGGWVND